MEKFGEGKSGRSSDDYDGVVQIRGKRTAPDLLQFLEDADMRLRLGTPGTLRAVARSLMIGGSKSLTHMSIVLERYQSVLDVLLRELQESPGAEVRRLVRLYL